MKIIFMGTPAFAVPALEALIEAGHEICAVYSQPPRPAGRDQQLQKSAVHLVAEKNNIPVYTPTSLKGAEEQQSFRQFEADYAVVAAYGLLLPKAILEGTKKGCLNIHPSLLPRWRGAAPIQRTIMAGDHETACCIMQMDEGLDTGNILACENMLLSTDITAGELHDMMAKKGADLLIKTLNTNPFGIEQAVEGVTYAKKITKEETRIDWSDDAEVIRNKIRGLAPAPGAWFEYNGERIKIFSAAIVNISGTPGTLIDPTTFTFACGKDALKPLLVQRAGKNVVPVEEFLRGMKGK
ncbi:MAG: methionyl-tRNA formyltransferase [Proteobacteria bacterium]|nr:methionyl-tRNA formyltransferase [Pseudomonadota bacterium]